jgi:hypothetical protein
MVPFSRGIHAPESLQRGFLGSEANVIGGCAGEDEDLETAVGGQLEHGLEKLDTVFVAVGERVIKENGQATVVGGGEDFGGGEANSGSDLLLGSTTK